VSDVHVVGIGNALVDVVTHADDAFIEKHGLARGAATMVDEARAETVYGDLGRATTSSVTSSRTICGPWACATRSHPRPMVPAPGAAS
jgi:hypothetical protein